MLFRIPAGLACVLVLFSCATDPIATHEPARPPATHLTPARPLIPLPSRRLQQDSDGFYFQPAGLADDYPEENTTLEKIKRDFDTLKAVGARFYRVGIGWDGIETAPGRFQWQLWDRIVAYASQSDITLIPYVCYTPAWLNADPRDFWRKPPTDLKRFGAFMHAIASRYKGKIRSWELWNEPDLENYWLGTPAQFAEMIIEAARQVRSADPAAVIVLGGMAKGRTPFLESLIRDYHVDREVDVLNVHGYFETWSSDPSEHYPRHLEEMRELLKQKDLWLAEFGYSDYRFSPRQASPWARAFYRYEHTPAYQAVALWKHHVLALASGTLSLTAWYRINDLMPSETTIGDDNNKHLGILSLAGKPKPAFQALRLYNRLFDQPVRLADRRVVVSRPRNSQSVVHVFEKKNGNLIVTGWLRSPLAREVKDRSGYAKDSRQEAVSLKLPIRAGSRLVVFDLSGNPSPDLPGKPSPASARLQGDTVSGVPLYGDRVFIAEIQAPTEKDAPAR